MPHPFIGSRKGVLALLCGTVCGACAGDAAPPPSSTMPPSPVAASGCLASGDGYFDARLRGAIEAQVHWNDAALHCEGGLRPDGKGIRVVLTGTVPAAGAQGPRHLRFIFGIDLTSTTTGPAQVLPTNLTVIIEGEQLLFSTGGSARCATQSLRRQPLLSPGTGGERIEASGYCIGPATDGGGTQRLFVPTFDFAGYILTEHQT